MARERLFRTASGPVQGDGSAGGAEWQQQQQPPPSSPAATGQPPPQKPAQDPTVAIFLDQWERNRKYAKAKKLGWYEGTTY